MKALGTKIYQLGPIEVDPSRGYIRRNGEEQYLRQKGFQLLVYLLEKRHRLVTKEELFDEIWEGMAVSDDALVQLIKEVRRSLGDNPRQPQFIKTFPKIGYRFIGPVEEHLIAGSATLETTETTTVEVEYEEESATDSQLVEMAARAWPAPRSSRWRSRRLILIYLSLAIPVAAIALVIYLRPVKRSLSEMTLPQAAGKQTVAVMHFENLSASHELDWLREGLTDMLITNLSRSTKLTVLGRQQLHLLLERLGRARSNEIQLNDALQIAQSSRADIVILGSFASVGDSIHISAQLYDARNNQALASENIVAAKPKDIIDQVDLLSLKVASHLGATTEEHDRGRGLTEAMTNNLEAYRYYSLAVEKANGFQNVEAIALLEKAVSLDPQFAMAYARIGYAYSVRWNFGETGKPYLEKAFQLSDRLTEKDRLYITAWYSIANFDYPVAIRYFQDLVAKYPLEVEAYWRLASLLQGEERPEEALNVAKRGLAVDREAKALYNQLGSIYLDLNRYDEAIEMYQYYLVLAPNEPNPHDSLGLVYQRIGRYDEAIKFYQRALALKADFEVAQIHLANVYFQQGRYREAISYYQRYIQIAPSEVERGRGHSGVCEVYLQKRDIDRAEQAASKESKSETTFSWHPLIIALERGKEAKANKLKEQLLARSTLANRGARESPRFYNYWLGYLELKSGRATEAIESFKEALKHRPPYWNIDTFEDCLANAYLKLERFDEAIAEYERVLSINPNYPLARYRLAQAYEGKGDRERARSEYHQFLDVWKDADRDLSEILAAQKRLE
jgi:tetratricopeptide (TPR) repeat protein/DNA-binding winged helix-turn-helix (wHTH) protein